MSRRITRKDLETKASLINTLLTGIATFRISGAYGVFRIEDENGHDPLYTGFVKPDELFKHLDAFICGIQYAQATNKDV